MSIDAYEAIRRDTLKRYLWLGDGREAESERKRNQVTLRRTLLNDLSCAAMDYASVNNVSIDTFENDFLPTAFEIVDTLQDALTDERNAKVWSLTTPEDPWNFWHHKLDPEQLVLNGKTPLMSREDILRATADYISLPYRCPSMDRVLTDVLIALEVYAFLDENVGSMAKLNRRLWLARKMTLLEPHPMGVFIWRQLISATVLLGGSYLLSLMPPQVYPTIVSWVQFLMFAVWCLYLVGGSALLPIRWFYFSKYRNKLSGIAEALVKTYAEMHDQGPLSAVRIREAASRASEAGVVWPGSLFALLDDNIKRSGKI